MVLLAPDANTGGDSSIPSDANEQVDSSSTEQAVEQAEESTDEQSETSETEESATEEQAEGTDTAEEQQSVEKEVETVETVKAELDKPEDAQLQFHKHPRFQEIIKEKNAVKQEFDSVKPLVEQSKALNDFLAQNQIPAAELQNLLQYAQLLRTNPEKAFDMMEPTYEQLATMVGKRLPADLQAEVATGSLSEERAIEIARARGGQTYQNWRQQAQQQGQTQNAEQVVMQSIQSWSQMKQNADPDFKPGSPLWEQVDLRIKSAPRFQNAQDTLAGTEKAYNEAKAFMAKLQPRTVVQGRKAPQSKATAANNTGVIRSAEDVMKAIKAGVKPHQMRYS